MMERIHHIVAGAAWERALVVGRYRHPSLAQEGFIHFSTREQIEGTARKHYAGQRDLLLLTIDPQLLDAELRWEPSRGGELFPHLYGELAVTAVVDVRPIDPEHPLRDLP